MEGDEVKVSVLVMTHNHEAFIEQALDSVLMQETTFRFEVLISEDCSTDRTRDIVLQYRDRHSDKIRLLLSEINLRTNYVVVRGLLAAKGQYVALLDGDDYWTDPHKLQIQSEFLDNHSECALCFHNALVIHEDQFQEPWYWTTPDQARITDIRDLWMGNYIATCSAMLRRNVVQDYPSWYDAMFPITDWPLYLMFAEHGRIGYIPRAMGVYRYHRGGLYSSLSDVEKVQKMKVFYDTMNLNTQYRYDRVVKQAMFEYFIGWSAAFRKRGETKAAIYCLRQCTRAVNPLHLGDWARMAGHWLRLLSKDRIHPGIA